MYCLKKPKLILHVLLLASSFEATTTYQQDQASKPAAFGQECSSLDLPIFSASMSPTPWVPSWLLH
jgi:hypothetical protein